MLRKKNNTHENKYTNAVYGKISPNILEYIRPLTNNFKGSAIVKPNVTTGIPTNNYTGAPSISDISNVSFENELDKIKLSSLSDANVQKLTNDIDNPQDKMIKLMELIASSNIQNTEMIKYMAMALSNSGNTIISNANTIVANNSSNLAGGNGNAGGIYGINHQDSSSVPGDMGMKALTI